MHRHVSLTDLPRLAAALGYAYILLSPREPGLAFAAYAGWFVHPRVYPERIKIFKTALKEHGVKLASLLPMYRWASPNEEERKAAVRYWKAAIQVAVERECDTMNSEFGRGGAPEETSCTSCCAGGTVENCEWAWWRSMEELVPIFERESINLHIEPHPEDFVDEPQVEGDGAVSRMDAPYPAVAIGPTMGFV